MANGYSTGMMGAVITTPTVIPQNVTNAIRVNETTPNLQMIQSFPVVSRNGNTHIHQDPVSGQMYEMTDEFHSMIPQILAGTSNVMSGVIVGGGMTGGSMPTAGGKIIVGGNISTSLLKQAPPQPTVSINGLEYKQSAKNGSIYNIFPEYFGASGDTYIDGVIYKQNNIPYGETETIISRRTQTSSPNQRQPLNRVKFAYPSVQRAESSLNNRTMSVSTPVKYVYPSVK